MAKGNISAQLTSCFTRLNSTKQINFNMSKSTESKQVKQEGCCTVSNTFSYKVSLSFYWLISRVLKAFEIYFFNCPIVKQICLSSNMICFYCLGISSCNIDRFGPSSPAKELCMFGDAKVGYHLCSRTVYQKV